MDRPAHAGRQVTPGTRHVDGPGYTRRTLSCAACVRSLSRPNSRRGGIWRRQARRGSLSRDITKARLGAEAKTMNAPNPTPGERDLDALRRAQRAHEPSMEEILASIRSIIADDREPALRPAAKAGAAPQGPQIVYSKDAPTARGAEGRFSRRRARWAEGRLAPAGGGRCASRARAGSGVEERRARRAAAFRPDQPGCDRRLRGAFGEPRACKAPNLPKT